MPRRRAKGSWLEDGISTRLDAWRAGAVTESRRLKLSRPIVAGGAAGGPWKVVLLGGAAVGAALLAAGSVGAAREQWGAKYYRARTRAVLYRRSRIGAGRGSQWLKDRMAEYDSAASKIGAAVQAVGFFAPLSNLAGASTLWKNAWAAEVANLAADRQASGAAAGSDEANSPVSGWNRLVLDGVKIWTKPGSDAHVARVKAGWVMEGREP